MRLGETTEVLRAPVGPPAAPARASGARSGALLVAASAVALVANYVFLLSAGRILGSEDYGALAALLGVLSIVLLPAGALQMAVSRELSRRLARGDSEGAGAFARAALRLAALATVPLTVALLALSAPLAELLKIDSVAVVALTLFTLSTAFVFPVATGVLQGHERFHALAVMYALPFLLRLLLLAMLAAAGYRLGGAVVATLLAALAGTAVALGLARGALRLGAGHAAPDLRPFLRYLALVALGLVGIALLTHVDIVVVKARFSGDEAGAYGAASAFARIGFFLPATILAVLVPRTAARQARGEATEDILGRSLLATAGFCAALAVFYAATGVGLVVTTFGAEFAEGGALLAEFALAMGLFSLANIFVGYHLSRGETRYAWIVGIGVVAQVALLATVPTGLSGVVWTNVAVGVALLAAHELFVGSSAPAIRAGLRGLRGQLARVRPLFVEGALALVGAAVFVCLLFLPVTLAFDTTIVGVGSDATGTVWWLWKLVEEGGYHLFGTNEHTLTGAPFGWEEDSGLNIQWLVPYYPAYLVAKVFGPVAAINVVVFSGYVLSGASMYALTRYVGCGRLVAAWAGMAYIVFPAHLGRTPHPSLIHWEFLPLALLALVAAFERPGWWRYVLVGLATAAAWLTSGYFGAMVGVSVVVFGLSAVLLARVPRWRLALSATIGAAVAATLFVSFLSVISGVGRGAGLARVASDLEVYGLRPLELLLPSPGNIVFGDAFEGAIGGQHGSNPTETSNYAGLLTLVLAFAWIVIAWRTWRALASRGRIATAGLVGVALASLLLAFPSPVTVFGHEIWMPSRVLWEIVPAFRVPVRWVAMLMAALVPLAALALQRGAERAARRAAAGGAGRAAVAAVVGAALVLSFLELTVLPAKNLLHTDETPARVRRARAHAAGHRRRVPAEGLRRLPRLPHVAARPRPATPQRGARRDAGRRRAPHGRPPGAGGRRRAAGAPRRDGHRHAPRRPQLLRDRRPRRRSRLGRAATGSSAAFPDGTSVWEVVAEPAAVLVTLPTGFGEPELADRARLRYALVSPSGVAYAGLRAREAGTIRLSFLAEPPRRPAQGAARGRRDGHEQSFTLDGPTEIVGARAGAAGLLPPRAEDGSTADVGRGCHPPFRLPDRARGGRDRARGPPRRARPRLLRASRAACASSSSTGRTRRIPSRAAPRSSPRRWRARSSCAGTPSRS